MLKFVLDILDDPDFINDKVTESKDFESNASFKFEYTGYTPLMLAIVSPYSDVECVKLLLSAKADYTIKDKHTGNNIFHLCAERCKNDKVFEYLLKNLKIDIFATNSTGETVHSICKRIKKTARIKIVEDVEKLFD